MKFHPNPATDLLLRVIGIVENRGRMHLVSHDRRTFNHRGVICKPDIIVLDKGSLELFVLEYKARSGENGLRLHEALQVILYGMAVKPAMESELKRKVRIVTGLLYGDDRKLLVEAEQEDFDRINGWIEPARQEMARRGRLSNGAMYGSDLAMFIAEQSGQGHRSDQSARNHGVQAHRTMQTFSQGPMRA